MPAPVYYGAPRKPPKYGCGTALLVTLGGGFVLVFVLSAIGALTGLSHGPATVSQPPATPSKASSPLADAQVKCSVTGLDSVNCSFESKGVGSAKACWDSVVECGGQNHSAHGCSALVPSGATESYSFTLDPPIIPQEHCTVSRIEHLVMQ